VTTDSIVDQDVQSTITMNTSVADQTIATSQAVSRANTETAGSRMSRRRLNAIQTSNKVFTQTSRNIARIHQERLIIHGLSELDSHANTCVAGSNCLVTEYTGETVSVSAFSKSHDLIHEVPIVKALTAYDDPRTGVTYILVLGQALFLGDDVESTLLCPNQLRYNGIIVDDTPIHLSPINQPSTHSIYFPDEDIRLQLSLKGCISYFHSRIPTNEEIESCKWITLTSDEPWDPHSLHFQEEEERARYAIDNNEPRDRTIFSLKTISSRILNVDPLQSISESFNDSHLLSMNISLTNTSNKTPHVNAEKLASRWNIGLDTALKTIKVTTQKGFRNALFPIEKRFRTKQAQLRYNQLGGRHGRFYSDTFFASVPTLRQCKMGQLYTNDIGFSKIYPMRLKSEVPDTLKTFIHDVGIPSAIHADEARELMEGKFRSLCKEFGIQVTYNEPHSPWQNRAEAGIKELKRHAHRKMKARNVPLRLWDFCCRWSCDVRSRTASNSFALEGRTPYEVVMGHTPDISSLAEFDFYEPVWYYESNNFPEPKRLISRWLGEANNIGQAMCYFILPKSGIPIARSTVQAISEADKMKDEVKSELKAFDIAITEN